ncbi:hypothetical protein AAG570_009511 [Ranatra chinensis]|uniref:Solute carrier family 25 member 35 n=1 Tax=Ranatra chinensis TaxID=642074 RepID=A0ABD0YPI6_9HEMI
MEFLTAAAAAMGSTLISNPLEVIKVRLQLQGELKERGRYKIHYRGFFHALYTIAKTDGLSALQKGLVPSLWHQVAEERRWNVKANGEKSLPKTALVAATLGGITAYTGSPFYLVKIQLQSQSSESIAVGTQHQIRGTLHGLTSIYNQHGITGLWRGCVGSLPRRCIGSATQLTSFTICKDLLANNDYFKIEKGYLNSLIASLIGGVIVTVVMNPLDVISNRLYNQGVDSSGRGLLYSSYMDCVKKMYKTEGIAGLYKGVIPMYLRTGPQTVLVLVFWDILKDMGERYRESRNI